MVQIRSFLAARMALRSETCVLTWVTMGPIRGVLKEPQRLEEALERMGELFR
ncbi:hypothetical protein SBA6_200025 [Candidatus Sulfopaludibacter sp. SbA6]|nr:hypothetical protein SBA6_200025 [Candidatus Sulfopaludibacter sp. SbA6]